MSLYGYQRILKYFLSGDGKINTQYGGQIESAYLMSV